MLFFGKRTKTLPKPDEKSIDVPQRKNYVVSSDVVVHGDLTAKMMNSRNAPRGLEKIGEITERMEEILRVNKWELPKDEKNICLVLNREINRECPYDRKFEKLCKEAKRSEGTHKYQIMQEKIREHLQNPQGYNCLDKASIASGVQHNLGIKNDLCVHYGKGNVRHAFTQSHLTAAINDPTMSQYRPTIGDKLIRDAGIVKTRTGTFSTDTYGNPDAGLQIIERKPEVQLKVYAEHKPRLQPEIPKHVTAKLRPMEEVLKEINTKVASSSRKPTDVDRALAHGGKIAINHDSKEIKDPKQLRAPSLPKRLSWADQPGIFKN